MVALLPALALAGLLAGVTPAFFFSATGVRACHRSTVGEGE